MCLLPGETNRWKWPMFMVGYPENLRHNCPRHPPRIATSFKEKSVQRWSALVEIVKSFNERGAPRLAFATVLAFLTVPLIALVLALSFDLPRAIGGP